MATSVPTGDTALVRYLLGRSSEEDSARFDELSIVDGEFAERLRGIEHDLADAYVRGALSAEDRECWERRYLASQRGRQDLLFAQALFAHDQRGSAPRHRSRVTWGLAAAAALFIATVAGYFAIVHRSAATTIASSIGPGTPARTEARLRIVSLTLMPTTRGPAELPSLQIPSGTDGVRLTLRLEPTDFTRFDITLKDSSSNAVIWQSPGVAASRAGGGRSIVVTIPAGTFQSRRYLVEVAAARPGDSDIIGTYPFRAVLQ
ncbi:MAG: hypothetical protein ACRD1V_21070 [Vicinamibacterales bacterium]